MRTSANVGEWLSEIFRPSNLLTCFVTFILLEILFVFFPFFMESGKKSTSIFVPTE